MAQTQSDHKRCQCPTKAGSSLVALSSALTMDHLSPLAAPWTLDAYSREKEVGSYSLRQSRMLSSSIYRHSDISRFHPNSNQSFLHGSLNTDTGTSAQMSFQSPPAHRQDVTSQWEHKTERKAFDKRTKAAVLLNYQDMHNPKKGTQLYFS